jgi:hypothetical protein
MNALLKQLLTAPWSNQPVSPFSRALAWILSVLFGLAFVFAGYFSMKEGVSGLAPEIALMIVVCFYIWLLFIYVARKGKAPRGWLPW